MPLNLPYNGNTYTVPLPNETYQWGGSLTSYFQALSLSLAPGTGAFNLTQTLDLGASYGLKTIGVKSGAIDFMSTLQPSVEARMNWSAQWGTVQIGLKGGNVTLEIGQDNVTKIFNNTGTTLAQGAVVRLTSSVNNLPTVTLAQASSIIGSSYLAVVAEPILNNAEGFVLTNGTITDLNTSAFTAGDMLYLSSASPGALTNIQPVAPNQSIPVAIVTTVSSTVGTLLVRPFTGQSLNRLSDVTITSPLAGQALVYDAGTSKFVNGTAPYATTQVVTPLTGGTTPMTTDDNLLFNLGATIATHTVTLPAAPVPNRIVRITLATTGAFNITTLTVNAAVAVRNPPTTLTPGIGCAFLFANSVWNRLY